MVVYPIIVNGMSQGLLDLESGMNWLDFGGQCPKVKATSIKLIMNSFGIICADHVALVLLNWTCVNVTNMVIPHNELPHDSTHRSGLGHTLYYWFIYLLKCLKDPCFWLLSFFRETPIFRTAVHHKLPGFVDVELQMTVAALCDQDLYQLLNILDILGCPFNFHWCMEAYIHKPGMLIFLPHFPCMVNHFTQIHS